MMFFFKQRNYTVLLIIFFVMVYFLILPVKATTYGRLIGIVKDLITEVPIKDASINISDEKCTYVISTDVNGKFSSGNLSPGEYKITVDMEDYDSIISSKVLIDSGVITINDFSLAKKRGVLSGIVKNKDTDKPIEGVMVRITDGRSTFSKTTDSLGKYIIDNIYAGTYGITASLENYDVEGPNSLSIIPGSTTKDFSLKRLKGEIFGRVMNGKNKEGIPGVIIIVVNGENTYETFTGSDGDFSITGICSGYYEVIAKDGDMERYFTDILIRGGSIISQDIIF